MSSTRKKLIYQTAAFFKNAVSVLAVVLLTQQICSGQPIYSKVAINKQMKDNFSFVNNWDYDWEIIKIGEGKFSSVDGRTIKAKDTIHLYFTANCHTNVQGGYAIRYCHAYKQNKTIVLKFSDGLPAYASEFNIYLSNDSMYFKPQITDPVINDLRTVSYTVTKQNLTLNNDHYIIGEKIIGYVDVEFLEKITEPGKEIRSKSFYLKGFLNTPIKANSE